MYIFILTTSAGTPAHESVRPPAARGVRGAPRGQKRAVPP